MPHSVIKKELPIAGTTYIKTYRFACGNEVPIYEVNTMHGLNQILGHVKFNNREYGDVYYRGQNSLYETLTPSLFREWEKDVKGTLSRVNTLDQIITKVIKSSNIQRDIKLGDNKTANRLKVEGMLQHYGVPTKCIDLVDNHWVALWMGLYKFVEIKMVEKYCHYQKREFPLIDLIKGEKIDEEKLYQYVLLLSIPNGSYVSDGLSDAEEYVALDLRKGLPSVFLRPHAQHAIVAERKVKAPKDISDYDMAPAVVCILRLRIDLVDKWLGNGSLLTQENLFPAPSADKGYGQLLTCQDILVEDYSLAKYV